MPVFRDEWPLSTVASPPRTSSNAGQETPVPDTRTAFLVSEVAKALLTDTTDPVFVSADRKSPPSDTAAPVSVSAPADRLAHPPGRPFPCLEASKHRFQTPQPPFPCLKTAKPCLQTPKTPFWCLRPQHTGNSRTQGGPFRGARRSARSVAAGNRIFRRRCHNS